jgi:hypothetical protein
MIHHRFVLLMPAASVLVPCANGAATARGTCGRPEGIRRHFCQGSETRGGSSILQLSASLVCRMRTQRNWTTSSSRAPYTSRITISAASTSRFGFRQPSSLASPITYGLCENCSQPMPKKQKINLSRVLASLNKTCNSLVPC